LTRIAAIPVPKERKRLKEKNSGVKGEKKPLSKRAGALIIIVAAQLRAASWPRRRLDFYEKSAIFRRSHTSLVRAFPASVAPSPSLLFDPGFRPLRSISDRTRHSAQRINTRRCGARCRQMAE